MAGRNSVPLSSWAESRRGSFDTSQKESFSKNEEFMRLLRRLPEELTRLESEIRKLKREANTPPSREYKCRHQRHHLVRTAVMDHPLPETANRLVDSASKTAEKFWKSSWENREKDLKSKHEEKMFQVRNHYEQQLKNNAEVSQKNNSDLLRRLKKSNEVATQATAENEELKNKLEKMERQLHEETGESSKYRNHSHRFKQALEEKRKELDNFKERHAAFSERKVRSDQRRTENTLSHNRQSQLESEYVTDFKDGARVDVIDIMTTRAARFRTSMSTPLDYLKCCRSACFFFETAYEVVGNMKDSFVSFSSTILKTLAVEAPVIGLDNTTFQSKLLTKRHPPQRENVIETHDALTELLILVKEEAKTHDLRKLVQKVNISLAAKWQQEKHLLVQYDSTLLGHLKDYIEYCTRFAWCALTQVPPLKIDYMTAVFDSGSHMVSQAFGSFETRSPTRRPVYPERQKILCYLWPVLRDCDGKVIRKGEVVLYN